MLTPAPFAESGAIPSKARAVVAPCGHKGRGWAIVEAGTHVAPLVYECRRCKITAHVVDMYPLPICWSCGAVSWSVDDCGRCGALFGR